VGKEYRLRYAQRVFGLAVLMAVSASVFAAEIAGTITNGTTGKPAAAVEVVLLSHAGGGMDPVGKTKTDAQGRFSIAVPDPEAQHLLRVNYQGVNYSASVLPGGANADITIFDAARQVAGIFEDARVYRLQTQHGELDVEVTYTIRNESAPPKTKMGDETYEIELPTGAQLIEASAAGPGGMPLPTSPVPTGKQNRYALVFPIRPGQTKLDVVYKMPYSGAYEFALTPDSQLSELGVLLPKSMQFTGVGRSFAQDSDEAGLAVYFTKNVLAHEQVKFSVSGEGVAPREAQGGAPPANAPVGGDPVAFAHSYAIWFVLAPMIIIILGGGFWLWRRASGPNLTAPKPLKMPLAARRAPTSEGVVGAPAPDTVLEALKDELFQLEKDRLDGKVSPEDHARLKAGLDALIRRHLKKPAQ
jgi:hypothetical protein